MGLNYLKSIFRRKIKISISEKQAQRLNGKRVLGTLLEVSEVEGAINAYKELEILEMSMLE